MNVNGRKSQNVIHDGTVVLYNITGLEYNTNYMVNVNAIDTCGLSSTPTSILVSIEARGQ